MGDLNQLSSVLGRGGDSHLSYTYQPKYKLFSSLSDHNNVYINYVCLVETSRHNSARERSSRATLHVMDTEAEEIDQEEDPIAIQRSKGLHNIEITDKISPQKDDKQNPQVSTQNDEQPKLDDEQSGSYFLSSDAPNILKLTKMKWLSESGNGSPDASPLSMSPTVSTSSFISEESDSMPEKMSNLSDKYLSTILKLDKEHNLFGLSNITIVGSQPSRRMEKKKDKERAVFHQTAIVQVCCSAVCCGHKSNTDLPSSLKCGGCRSCCGPGPCGFPCGLPCGVPCSFPPCPSPRLPSCCKSICPPAKCYADCAIFYGMKIVLNKKPKFEPSPVEITPRSSCVLQKPLAARKCTHCPPCLPPASCYNYLTPCYWPARSGAPCTHPDRCFHHPPCPPPRRKAIGFDHKPSCPKTGKKCEDEAKKTTCPNRTCPGYDPAMRKEFESRFKDKPKEQPKDTKRASK